MKGSCTENEHVGGYYMKHSQVFNYEEPVASVSVLWRMLMQAKAAIAELN